MKRRKKQSSICIRCGEKMEFKQDLKFNGFPIKGWKCMSCGEAYYDPEEAQRVLVLSQLKKEILVVKLGRSRDNLIIRVPKKVERALHLEKGENVNLKVEKDGFRIEISA